MGGAQGTGRADVPPSASDTSSSKELRPYRSGGQRALEETAGFNDGSILMNASPTHVPLTGFLDCMPWPVILIDEKGEVRYLNDAAKSRHPSPGSSGMESLGSLQDLFPEYYQSLQGDVPWLTQQVVDVSRKLPDGPVDSSIVYEQVWLRRIPEGACLVVIDQTRLHELEVGDPQTIRLASLGFMVASVTHEVSNPLSAIHSMVQLLQSKRGLSPDAVEKGLLNIADAVKRILSITRKLNAFSRVDDEDLTEAPIDIPIEEAIRQLGYDGFGQSIEIHHQHEAEAVVLGRIGQLQQVFYNLVFNAAQAMNGKGSIWIVTRRVAPYTVTVSVHDSGPGLPPEHMSKIFEPFFTTKRSGEGSGLGLAISNEIVREHGGSMWAENHPEGGACFHVLLPLAGRIVMSRS